METQIKVETAVAAPTWKIWKYWNEPEHITKWYAASDDWHTPKAENDLRVGGRFKFRMEAKDGSSGFDLEGTYAAIEEHKRIEYVIDGGRKVRVEFLRQGGGGYRIAETFDPENENPLEMQKNGWQAILDNFKKYVEG